MMSFENLGLNETLLKNLSELGYSDPTPIQSQAIPYILMNRDVLGSAQTGTGKTACYTLPLIEILAGDQKKALMPRCLVLVPTRELALQVGESFEKFGKGFDLNYTVIIGGTSAKTQDDELKSGVDVIIATPGRLMDHIEKQNIIFNDLKTLVIDEADRLLDMGFLPDIEKICSVLPKLRQTLLFSATYNDEIEKVSGKFLMNPKPVIVDKQTSTAAETIEQKILECSPRAKRSAMKSVLKDHKGEKGLIFCNRKKDIYGLTSYLRRNGISNTGLHGDLSQEKRTDILAKFKAGEVTVLVCSDVAARGIDIADVTFVINYDVPQHAEEYIHRIGRTGRAGNTGNSYTLATPDDAKYVQAIEKLIDSQINREEFSAPSKTKKTSDKKASDNVDISDPMAVQFNCVRFSVDEDEKRRGLKTFDGKLPVFLLQKIALAPLEQDNSPVKDSKSEENPSSETSEAN